MKKISLLAGFIAAHFICFAQFTAYYPSGKKIPYKLSSINNMKDSLGIKDVDVVDNPYGTVLYKKLTNVPVFLFFHKRDDLTKLPLMLKAYDYQKHINSYSYYYDIKKMIDSGVLTKSYLINSFGQPTSKYLNDDNQEVWIFKKNNARIKFNDTIANQVDIINYKTIDTHKLAITDFSVTGEDYSIGFDITFSNLSTKTIKYLYINVTAKNPVKDVVGTKMVRAIGPIKPNESSLYNFENTFFSSTAEYLHINSIKIQYMDGSVKLLTKSQVDSIKITDWSRVE
ncbi:hypothetical protein OQZ33_04375 [Pedobacter sp. MC2016-05]|uniref:hypothetical protein n=1 Tax=Pedobacter sp. MC2016-05 TaxID=2994474 RepID=UPI002247D53E|nr:hypothetical protein [Pedobacter sp. MC2016-05]MCX2473562.1 hypothetical protein [Pedobacter sp. MC2016-05]